jgi:hypothetical protein
VDNDSNVEEFDENIEQYYGFDVIRGRKWFLCKFGDCEVTEIDEKLMKEHIRQHLSSQNIDENEVNFAQNFTNSEVFDSSVNFVVDTNQSNEGFNEFIDEIESEFDSDKSDRRLKSIGNKSNAKKYVCNWFEYNRSFTYYKPYESHINEHMIQDSQNEDRYNVQKVSSSQTVFNDLEEYIEVINSNGNEVFLCIWSDCDFNSDSFDVISKHIRCKHFNIKQRNFDKSFDYEQEFWAHNREHQRSHSNCSNNSNKVRVEANEQMVDNENIALITDNMIMKTNNNTNSSPFLSCKGLQSTKNVKKYFERKFINGEKVFFCKWNRCQYKTKTKGIATHIYLRHLKLEFKCNQQNCSKVFQSPHAWREHQKNHICGFGIDGNEKRKIDGICGNNNINKYREKILVNEKRIYRCKWTDCGVISKHHMSMKRHIHNQHICPFRMKGKSSQKSLKPEPKFRNKTSKSTSSHFKQMFKCKHRGCRFKFAEHSDLIKHQNSFCLMKPFVKSVSLSKFQTNDSNNLMPQRNEFDKNQTNFESQRNSNHKKVKSNSKEILKTNKIEEYKNQLLNRKSFAESQSNISSKKENSNQNIEKFFVTSLCENSVEYHLCQWNDCKFATKFWHKIIDHIQNEHLVRNSDEKLDNRKVDANRKFISNDTLIDSNTYKVKQIKSQDFNEKNVNNRKPSTETQQNTHKFEKYMTQKSIDDEPYYFCKWKDCKFYSKSLDQISKHINQTHIDLEFKCDERNCSKSFKTSFSLRLHKKNHICGFGIEGRIGSGVCNVENVRKYRKEIFENNKLLYECKWNGCDFVSDMKGFVLNHIHNQHICPNRKTDDLNISTNNKSDKY